MTEKKSKINDKGYLQKRYKQAVKRYCQTLDLVEDVDLINEYIRAHNEDNHWKEIGEGLRAIGVLEMEIYIHGNKLFMIVETGLDFDWDAAFSELETLPKQIEWEKKMSVFQRTKGERSADKWLMMERIFHFYDSKSP